MKFAKLSLLVLMCAAFVSPAHALNLVIINNNGPAVGPFKLVSSNPHDWQKVDTAPTTISLTFSQPARADKGFIRLYNLTGDQLDTGEIVEQGSSLSMDAHDLTTGKYVIKWRVRCACDDNTELSDSIHFTVQ